MKTLVRFKNFEHLAHIQEFVENSLKQSVGKFEARRDFEAEMTLKTIRGRSDNHRPLFECELLIRGRKIGHPIFVKKESSDLYDAIHDCLRAGEKILRRSAKIRVSQRRHVNIEPLSFQSPDSLELQDCG